MTGTPWTIGQSNRLLAEAETKNWFVDELAERHGRTKASIDAKLRAMGREDLVRYRNGNPMRQMKDWANEWVAAEHETHIEAVARAGGFPPPRTVPPRARQTYSGDSFMRGRVA